MLCADAGGCVKGEGEEVMGVSKASTRITPGTLMRTGAHYEALGRACIACAKSLFRLADKLPRTWALEVPDVTGLDGDGI